VNCHNALDDNPDVALRSVGKPNPQICAIKIVDEQRVEAPPDVAGESTSGSSPEKSHFLNAPIVLASEPARRLRNRRYSFGLLRPTHLASASMSSASAPAFSGSSSMRNPAPTQEIEECFDGGIIRRPSALYGDSLSERPGVLREDRAQL